MEKNFCDFSRISRENFHQLNQPGKLFFFLKSFLSLTFNTANSKRTTTQNVDVRQKHLSTWRQSAGTVGGSEMNRWCCHVDEMENRLLVQRTAPVFLLFTPFCGDFLRFSFVFSTGKSLDFFENFTITQKLLDFHLLLDLLSSFSHKNRSSGVLCCRLSTTVGLISRQHWRKIYLKPQRITLFLYFVSYFDSREMSKIYYPKSPFVKCRAVESQLFRRNVSFASFITVIFLLYFFNTKIVSCCPMLLDSVLCL